MQLFDTHTHIDIELFDHDRNDILDRARKQGVIAHLIAGFSSAGWENILSLSKNEADLYASIGIHPLYLQDHIADDLLKLSEHCSTSEIIAIGEIGLDFFHGQIDKKNQLIFFEEQLNIATTHSLPVLLHVRKAHDQTLSLLRRKSFSQGGIVHAYSGSLQQAEKYIAMGFLIGFGGTITYDRAKKRRHVAANLPLESLVLESDAPDMPPANHHKENNLPEYLVETADALAQLHQCSTEHIAAITTKNAQKLLFKYEE